MKLSLILTALLPAQLAALGQDSATKPGSGRAAFFEESILWQNKEENAWPYHVYGLVQSTRGTLLAFAEGRQGKGGDADPHHLVVKRSTDGGRAWSRNIYVERGDGSFWAVNGQPGKLECWTNTGPVVDGKTGRVFFFYALNEGTREQNWTRVFYRYSDDDGQPASLRCFDAGQRRSWQDVAARRRCRRRKYLCRS